MGKKKDKILEIHYNMYHIFTQLKYSGWDLYTYIVFHIYLHKCLGFFFPTWMISFIKEDVHTFLNPQILVTFHTTVLLSLLY